MASNDIPSLDLTYFRTISPMLDRFTNPESPDFDRNYSGGEPVTGSDEQVQLRHTQLGTAVDLPTFDPTTPFGPKLDQLVSLRTLDPDGGISSSDISVFSGVDLEGGVHNGMTFKASDGQHYGERELISANGEVTKTYTRRSSELGLSPVISPEEISEAEFEAAKETSNISLDIDDLDKTENGTLELDQELLDKVADSDDEAIAPLPPPPPEPPSEDPRISPLTGIAGGPGTIPPGAAGNDGQPA